MIGDGVLSDDGLQATSRGLDVDLRLPWYRGLPLSAVEIGEVRINGQVISPDAMSLGLNGKNFHLSDLENHFSELWFVLDSASLHVEYPQARRGQEYEVEVTITLWPPYIIGLAFPKQVKRHLRAN
jgi:hypothetical protein